MMLLLQKCCDEARKNPSAGKLEVLFESVVRHFTSVAPGEYHQQVEQHICNAIDAIHAEFSREGCDRTRVSSLQRPQSHSRARFQLHLKHACVGVACVLDDCRLCKHSTTRCNHAIAPLSCADETLLSTCGVGADVHLSPIDASIPVDPPPEFLLQVR